MKYTAQYVSEITAEREPRTYALINSPLWSKLPIRLQTALAYAAICGHDADCPPATRLGLLHWLDSNSARKLPLLGIKTRAQAMLMLA